MMFMLVVALVGWVLSLNGVRADTMLFNGAQAALFEDASDECLIAFNTSLACNSMVQLLSYDMDRLEFTEASLTNLCTSSCLSSLLDLDTAVASACGTYDFEFNGAYLSAVQVVDLFIYKYNMSCLADSSGSFCLVVEETWDVGSLNSTGDATWPTYTNKTFPNFKESAEGTPTEDVNGTLVDLSDASPTFYDYGLNLSMAGQDYYQDGISLDWEGHGWPEALEYDEYPLKIQCSECFLAQYKLGIESQWGEVYDEVSDQVWNNLKLNCELEWDLVPANNLSTWNSTVGALQWSYTPTCGQTIVYNATDEANYTTANDLALANNVPTAALMELNSISWNRVLPGSYCAPESCQVAIINGTMGAKNFVALYDNITETQFWSWNNYMDSKNLIVGEIVCIGPPGGAYTPISGTVASPTVYTTTATPAVETPAGTIANCGLYYEVESGDECNTVALAYSLTLNDFLAMNPEVNANCSNLWIGYDYCVALVNGTSITTAASTGTTTATATASFVAAPTQTVTGTTSQCYEWYTVQSDDTCTVIEDDYGITLAYFRSLNTYVDAACDNIWPNYAYCVDGIAVATTTSMTAAATSTLVAAPTQTVSGTTDECYEWYTVQSGDTCTTIEDDYDITLAYFRSLNTNVDAACDNLWANYAYCVNGVAAASYS